MRGVIHFLGGEEASPFWVFLLLTVILGGGAAFLTGRAIAAAWRPWWHVLGFMNTCLMLTPIFLARAFEAFARWGASLTDLMPCSVQPSEQMNVGILSSLCISGRQSAAVPATVARKKVCGIAERAPSSSRGKPRALACRHGCSHALPKIQLSPSDQSLRPVR